MMDVIGLAHPPVLYKNMNLDFKQFYLENLNIFFASMMLCISYLFLSTLK